MKSEPRESVLPFGLLGYLALLVVVATLLALRLQGDPQLPMIGWRIILGAVSNATCALLGCFLVLRRMSLLVDAISHAVLPGIVVVFLFTGNLSSGWMVVGAVVVGLLTTVLTQALSATGEVAEDSSMGLVYTGLFAIGVLMINQFAGQVDLDPGCVLYGTIDLATVEISRWNQLPHDFPRLAIVLGGTILFLMLLWKELKIVAFDPALARAMGLSVSLVHYALMAMVAIASVASFEVVGSILVVAMFIVPAATAMLLTDRLGQMLAWGAALAVGSALLGDIFASWLDTSVAGMMSVVAGAQLTAAVFFSPRGGVISRWWRNMQLSLRIQREDVLATLYRREEGAATTQPVDLARPELSAGWLPALARGQLRWQKLLLANGSQVELTPLGRETARSIIRSHRLWETYLQKHFDLPADHLHEPAERMEHFIDERLQAELTAELGEETHDPHGRAIPRDEK